MDAPAFRTDRPPDRRRAAARARALMVDGMRVRFGHLPPSAGRPGHRRRPAGPGRVHREVWRDAGGASKQWGFAAAILDWRGQGGSDRFLAHRHRGHVVQVEDYLADLAAVHGQGRRSCACRGRLLMLSHSMGGHIGLRYLHAHGDQFAGSVMSAPMFGIRLTPTPEPVARAHLRRRDPAGRRARASRRASATSRSERYVFARNRLTSSPERYAELRRRVAATPELALGGVTYRLARRRPALDRADPAAGLSGGDRHTDPGLPGRRRADRQQPGTGRRPCAACRNGRLIALRRCAARAPAGARRDPRPGTGGIPRVRGRGHALTGRGSAPRQRARQAVPPPRRTWPRSAGRCSCCSARCGSWPRGCGRRAARATRRARTDGP